MAGLYRPVASTRTVPAWSKHFFLLFYSILLWPYTKSGITGVQDTSNHSQLFINMPLSNLSPPLGVYPWFQSFLDPPNLFPVKFLGSPITTITSYGQCTISLAIIIYN